MTHALARDAGTGRRGVRSPAAVAVAALVWMLVPAGTSPAWASGACPTLDDGVTVVVDFQHLGGGAVVRCAPGDPSSGLAALAAAGFRVDQVANQPGFVCRIDGLPGPADEDCADTPPAKAYWGYSYAQRGGSWGYSGSGAHVRDPAVGTVEGWAFNGGGGSTQPTVAPPPPPAPEPRPSPSPASSPSSSGGDSREDSGEDDGQATVGADHGSGGGRGSSAATATDGDGAADGDPVPASTSPEPEATTSAAAIPTERPSPTATDAPPTAVPAGTPTPGPTGTAAGALEADDAGGTPWATLAGVLLIVGLLAGAALVRRRGARADGG